MTDDLKQKIKDSLFLPKTDFPMRGNLAQKEPEILAKWKNLYKNLRTQSKGRQKFILNFGPPFANGHLHIGHFLSYALKDIVNKTYQMMGYDAPMVLGWDCHGLPIEWAVEEHFKKEGKDKGDIIAFRKSCRNFATHWIEIQKSELIRYGIIADSETPYVTMDFHTEGRIVEILGHFLLNKTLYRGLRPVLWSVVEKTALADNEIEYKDITSDSVYVAFPAKGKDFSLVIWTTTPWTLPANRAISYNHNLHYVVVLFNDNKYVVAKECLPHFEKDLGHKVSIIQERILLNDIVCEHPLKHLGYDFDVPLLNGEHVTKDAGTGLVHTAPGHGVEDFEICKQHNIPVPNVINEEGIYFEHVPFVAGQHIFKVNPVIIDALKECGALLAHHRITHSYPHSWRSKKPVIYRTTEQWFIDVTTDRKSALDAIEEVNWFPKQGKNRIKSMVENRPDWCISRQRAWGTPIAIFMHKVTGEPLRDAEVHKRVVDLIKEKGGDVWYTEPPETFLGDKYNANDYEKVTDILDCWFESGSVHEFVLKDRPDLSWPADLVLEGSDQHRGWFQGLLLTSCALYGKAPYKNVVTHGFVLDEHGHKMSKSVGNVTDPQKVIEKHGADLLRQWVVFADYSEDLRIGSSILTQQEEVYRRFRNTIRYLLGGVCHPRACPGDPGLDSLHKAENDPELEKYILHLLAKLDQLHKKCVTEFDFSTFYKELYQFCNTDLSSFYFDIRKDTLYCDANANPKRLANQRVMKILLDALLRYLAPVLSFTCEEAYETISNESIHMQQFIDIPTDWVNEDLAKKWDAIRELRSRVNEALEKARKDQLITASLQAHVDIYSEHDLPINAEDLNEICITGSITYHKHLGELDIKVSKQIGEKCERCWKILPEVRECLCDRCRKIVD